MREEDSLDSILKSVGKLLKPGSNRPVDLRTLDDATQRRILLQAAKQCGQFGAFSKSQPNYDELQSKIRENFWAYLLLGFFCFFPWFFIPMANVPLMKVRGMAQRFAILWQKEVDPECAHVVLVGDIRRMLKKLPKNLRRDAKEINRELDRMSDRWRDLQSKIERLSAAERFAQPHGVDATGSELAGRISREIDPMVLASLQRRLDELEGRRKALADIATWQARLMAAQEECNESLLHLRARLGLMGTSSFPQEAEAVTEMAGAVQSISARLAATQDASEEVLRLST